MHYIQYIQQTEHCINLIQWIGSVDISSSLVELSTKEIPFLYHKLPDRRDTVDNKQ